MRKSVIAVAVAAVLWTPEASGQTILQKTDWRAKSFESYLPPPILGPGLDLDLRTKPPRRDLPVGCETIAVLSFQLHRSPADARVSSIAMLERRM